MSPMFDWLGDSGKAAFLADVLSFGAIIVSAIAFAKSHKVQKQLVEIEKARDQDRVVQSRKAHLAARIRLEQLAQPRTSQIGRKCHLLVANAGPARAHDVSISLEGRPISESDIVEKPNQEIRDVEPETTIQYEFRPGLNRHIPLLVELSWRDDSDEMGKWSMRLTESE